MSEVFPELDREVRIKSQVELDACKHLMGYDLWASATPYQKRGSVRALAAMKQGKDVAVHAPPSAGKTRLSMMVSEAAPSFLARDESEKNAVVISASHTRAIHNQTIDDYAKKSSVKNPGEFTSHKPVKVGSGVVLTMVGHLLDRKGENPERQNVRRMGQSLLASGVAMVTIDEAHHMRARETMGYEEVFFLERGVNAAHARKSGLPVRKAPALFLSATFERDDSAELDPRIENAERIYISPEETLGLTALPVRTVVSPYRYTNQGVVEGQAHDLAKTRFGQTPQEVSKALTDDPLAEASITKGIRAARARIENRDWLDTAIQAGEDASDVDSPQILTFFDRLEDIKEYEPVFEKRYPGLVASISEKTTPQREAEILDELREGKLRAVLNCKKIDEGASVEGLDIVLNCRALLSRRELIQMSGRAARADHSRGKREGIFVDAGAATFVRGDVEAQTEILNAKARLQEADIMSPEDAIEALGSITSKVDLTDEHQQRPRRFISIADEVYAVTRRKDENGSVCFKLEVRDPVTREAKSIYHKEEGQPSANLWPAKHLANFFYDRIKDNESHFAREGGPNGLISMQKASELAKDFPMALKRRQKRLSERSQKDPAARRVHAMTRLAPITNGGKRLSVKELLEWGTERIKTATDQTAPSDQKAKAAIEAKQLLAAADKLAKRTKEKFDKIKVNDPFEATLFAEAAQRVLFNALPEAVKKTGKEAPKLNKDFVANRKNTGLQETWMDAAKDVSHHLANNPAKIGPQRLMATPLINALSEAQVDIGTTFMRAQALRRQEGSLKVQGLASRQRGIPKVELNSSVQKAIACFKARRDDYTSGQPRRYKEASYDRACELRRRNEACNKAITRQRERMHAGGSKQESDRARQAWARMGRIKVKMELQYDVCRKIERTGEHVGQVGGGIPSAEEKFPSYEMKLKRQERDWKSKGIERER